MDIEWTLYNLLTYCSHSTNILHYTMVRCWWFVQVHTLLCNRSTSRVRPLVSTSHLAAPQATTGLPLPFVAAECGAPGGIICMLHSLLLGLQHIKVARSSLKDDQYLPPQASQQGQLPSYLVLISAPTYHTFIAYIALITNYPSSLLCLTCATF